MRYPLDLSPLNQARETLEQMIDELHEPADPPQKACGLSGDPGKGEKPRAYRGNARKDYLNTSKKKKKSAREIRKAIGKQLRYIKRDWGIVCDYLSKGKKLSEKRLEQLEVVEKVYEQQLFMWKNRVHQVENRIVSLSQPWIRPIARGKAKAKTEFGAKLDISVVNGFTRLEHSGFDACNESENLIEIIKRFRAREGHFPERALADAIYRTRENLKYC